MITTEFKLSDKFVKKYENIEPPFGFNGLGKLVYMRTYSRIKLDGTNEQWWETIQRVVEGTYVIQKEWIQRHQLGWNEKQGQQSAKEMYDRMFYMKFLPPGRGLWAMGSSIINEKNLYAALNNCFHGNEKYITRQGLKTFKETSGTKQFVLSKNNEWIESEIKNFGKQEIVELILTRQGIYKKIKTTANHRWLAKSKSQINHNKGYSEYTTSQLLSGYRLPYNFGQKQNNFSPHGVVAGFTFGDGTKGRIDLQFGKDEELLPYLNSFRIHKRDTFYRINDVPEHYKELPNINWDKKYLYGWLIGYFAADGSVDKKALITLSSSKKENLLFVKDICTMLGIGTYSIQLSSTSSNYKEKRELWKLTFIPSTINENFFLIKQHKINFDSKKILRNWIVFDKKYTGIMENVFCAVVPKTGEFTLKDNILTKNCAFVSTSDLDKDPTKPFCFLMDMSMLGVGVGFDIKGAGKVNINLPKNNDFTGARLYIIPDTREGWVHSLKLLLESYFNETKSVAFSYYAIREAGAPIKGFGGVSSGSGPLEELHCQLRIILNENVGKTISKTLIVDIMNLIGKCVVSGNVRRTAEIVFGDMSLEYLNLKNYKINPHREVHGWTSNNSVYAKIGMNYNSIATRIKDNGEPGLIWLKNMQHYSRMNGKIDNKDLRVKGANPCVEQSLEPYELCCLVETFPMNHETLADYQRTLKYAYLYAKTVTLGNTHWPETNRVMLRNRRIGCSVSGIAQFITANGINKLKEWLTNGYNAIQYWDNVYSEWLAIPKSIKTTSVKPSGTVSLLVGATPGLHYPESRFYIRRVRISNNSDLIQPLKNAGYNIEPAFGAEKVTSVVEVPVDVGIGIKSVKDISIWEQFHLASFMQRYWSDNQVSCTITFDPEKEGNQIEPALNYFQYQLKGISLLPRHNYGAFPQMPYEAINEERYNEMLNNISELNFSNVKKEEALIEKFCDGEYCEIN